MASIQDSAVLALVSAAGSYLALEAVEGYVPASAGSIEVSEKLKRSIAIGIVVLASDQAVKRLL